MSFYVAITVAYMKRRGVRVTFLSPDTNAYASRTLELTT